MRLSEEDLGPEVGARHKMDVQTLFDALAPEYARERERQYSFQSQKAIVLAMLAGRSGRVLDVGCGPGVMTVDLLERGFQVRGLDVSSEMLRHARARVADHPMRGRCTFELGDIERLQRFPNGHFDVVVGMGVLEYLPDYTTALRETRRVLKPGGLAILTVPNRMAPYHVARRFYDRTRGALKALLRRKSEPLFRPNRCVPRQLDRQLAQAGLRKIEGRSCNFIFFPLYELSSTASAAVNRWLAPLSASARAPWLGAQYVVKAQKTPAPVA